MVAPRRITAAHMEQLPKTEPFQVRDHGADDDAWQTVRPESVLASRRPEKSITEPNKTVWVDFVTVELDDGTTRMFNHDDEVEVRSLPE